MMRRLPLTGVIAILSLFGQAQVYVDGLNQNTDSLVHYLEVTHESYPNDFYLETIDNGKIKNMARARFTQPDGKKITFRSSVELLHYMRRNGWRLAEKNTVIDTRRNSRTMVYLLFEKGQ